MLGYLEKISKFLNRLLLWAGGVGLLAMILLVCSNIFLRFVWVPVKGTYELMGFFGAVVAAFALGHTQKKRGHIAVDVLVNQFSRKTREVLNSVNYFLCTIFFAIAAWQIATWGTTLWQTGEIAETLRIIYFPFIYAVALGCAVLALVLLTDLLKSFMEDKDVNT